MGLRCTSLDVSFVARGAAVQALAGLSFDTDEREFVSIVGPSGCGKTTLLRTIAGLIRPQRGTVTRRDRAHLVFQENSLFPWMTVLENAAFGLEMQRVGAGERRLRAMPLLERFGLGGREGAYPRQLSLGMKQRVAVIRAFLSGPAVLLMDEPFASLDYFTRRALGQELVDLWEQNRTPVIFVTHDIEEAILLSDRVLVMSPRPGRIAAEYRVPFGRPRDAETAFCDEFLQLKKRIAISMGMIEDWAAAAC
jgi:NitT/TauT family transport system ATP-binding protein